MSRDISELLPSADMVRCKLCLDLAIHVTGLVEAAGLTGRVKELDLLKQVKEQRDEHLLERLQQVLPLEDLTRISDGQDVIDLEELSRQFPFVYVMWVMVSATDLSQLAEAIEKAVTQGEE